MKHCLRLSSLLWIILLVAGCAGPYKSLKFYPADIYSAFIYRPVFDKELYRCVVDGRFLFKKFHLSGVLFFKTMEDKSTRVVFQNEMGFSFFDFEWTSQDSFKVNQVIPQLDKPAVIKALQKDLNLLLMKNLDGRTMMVTNDALNGYYRFTLPGGYAYYKVHNDTLQQIENTGKKKKVITIALDGHHSRQVLPDSILFTHHNANFTIQLTKINAHADE